jgi:hypothetical protein
MKARPRRSLSETDLERAWRARRPVPGTHVVKDQGKRYVAVSAHELLDYYSDCNQPPGHSY